MPDWEIAMLSVQSYFAPCCRVLLLTFYSSLLPSIAHADADAGSRHYTRTKYPIVLVPGAFGFGAMAGVLDYWFNMAYALTDGGAEVYLVRISPLNSTELRGEQLVSQIQYIVATTGAPKVNLIGHSHGGPTARYAAAVVPDLVASVTSIASPHKGSAVADWLTQHPRRNTPLRRLLVWFCNVFANLIGWTSDIDHPNSALAGMQALNTRGSALFNSRYPAGLPTDACGEGEYVHNGQRYYSWSGVAYGATNRMDLGDPLLAFAALAFGHEPNDGLVGRCSSHFGEVIRDDYNQNHLDNVNHILGLVAQRDPSPVELLRVHANRLKQAGY